MTESIALSCCCLGCSQLYRDRLKIPPPQGDVGFESRLRHQDIFDKSKRLTALWLGPIPCTLAASMVSPPGFSCSLPGDWPTCSASLPSSSVEICRDPPVESGCDVRPSERTSGAGKTLVRVGPFADYALGAEPGENIRASTTPTERLAMMWELSRQAWTLSGRLLPDYPRHRAPGRVVRSRQ